MEANKTLYKDNLNETVSSTLYEVEKVLKKGIGVDNKVYYKIKWANEPESQSTWEPLENLGSIDDLIQEYENELPKRPHPVDSSPEKINYAKMHNKMLYLNVSWKKNTDGSPNPNSFILYEELRESHPLLIINFYETGVLYGKKEIEIDQGGIISN